MMDKIKNNKGFTLAEILLAMAIIGVISALTIPAAMNSINQKVWTDQLKVSFEDFQGVARIIMQQNRGTLVNAFPDSNTALNMFCNNVDCLKVCYAGQSDNQCFTDDNWKNLQGAAGWQSFYGSGIWGRAILSNGTQFAINAISLNCTQTEFTKNGQNWECAQFYVDVNGFNPPNTMGRDLFGFYIGRDGLYPLGIDNSHVYGASTYCNPASNNFQNGNGCTGVVLEQGYMNY